MTLPEPMMKPNPSLRLARSVAAVAGALLLSCASAAELTVSAASSLTNAFKELATAFEAAHPGDRVLLNFGASGALLAQIAKGAPVDVFASADQQTMDQAAQQNLVRAADRFDFVSNRLVVIVPVATKAAPASLPALRDAAWQRIAIGQPASVPVGRYTQAVLERDGLWDALQPRLVLAQNVRQALDYVARGEVDAGFVFATDAAIAADQVRVAFDVPTVTPVRYPAAALSGAPHPEQARQFAAFLRTDEAFRILSKYGFGRP